MTEDIDSLRARVAKACRVVGRMGLTRALRGHISARIPGTERIFVRARGPAESGVRYTGADEVVEVDLDGRPVKGMPAGLRSPSEIFIHTEIYRARPEVNAVLHMHPPTVVLFTIVGKPLLPLYGGYDPHGLGLVLEGIPVFDRSVLINTRDLGREFAGAMGTKRACLMRGHGITTVGESIEEAGVLALGLNELATINFQAHMLGEPRPISDEDKAGLQPAISRLSGRSPTPGEPSPSTGAEWRYYSRLADEVGGLE
jgi:L-fuculose-phosphate aldolase